MTTTPNESNQIDYIKRIITKIFATLNLPKSIALIAMTELIIYTMAHDRKDIKDLKEKSDLWYNEVVVNIIYTMGPSYIEAFNKIEALEKDNPGILEAMKQLANSYNNDVQVRFVSPEDTKNNPGDTNIDDTLPVSTTKH